MAATLNALLDQPILLLAVLAIGAAIGMGIEKYFASLDRNQRRAYWRGRNWKRQRDRRMSERAPPYRGDLAAEQLKTVMKAKFRRRALLNKPEAKVFQSLDKIVIARNPGWQVMAQVSVGEFLACDDADAFACINSKRVDFVLMDEKCQACHALEYQGNGHHQGSAAARDAVKKEALRKAGVGYHEIVAGHTTPGDLRQLVEKLVPEAGA
jgi:hypothetical protein